MKTATILKAKQTRWDTSRIARTPPRCLVLDNPSIRDYNLSVSLLVAQSARVLEGLTNLLEHLVMFPVNRPLGIKAVASRVVNLQALNILLSLLEPTNPADRNNLLPTAQVKGTLISRIFYRPLLQVGNVEREGEPAMEVQRATCPRYLLQSLQKNSCGAEPTRLMQRRPECTK